MINKEKLQLLAQLAEMLDEATKNLEASYNAHDIANLEKYKGVVSEYQKKISEILK